MSEKDGQVSIKYPILKLYDKVCEKQFATHHRYTEYYLQVQNREMADKVLSMLIVYI